MLFNITTKVLCMLYSWIILNLWIDEVTGVCNVWKEWSIILHKRSTSIIMGSKRWCSGESACLPPMWPRFKTRCWRHMWVEFVVGSLPYSERFLLYSKSNIFKFQFDQESGRRRTTLWMCYLQIIIYLFIYFIRLCSMACIEYDLVETMNSIIKFWVFWFLQALTLALTLHEKGRSELKKRNYAEALLLLLEAEKEFRYSQSSPCDHSHELPALVTTTSVKPRLNCDLNFVIKALICDHAHFWDYPTGLFLCF